MTDQAQTLLRDALSLSAAERADLAAELLASLEDTSDDPAAVRELWAEEIAVRARRVLAGDSDGEDWFEVRERLGRQLAGE